jgi:cyclohexa-1,5-dienecarbonyl-CoA hydratase
MASIEFYPGPRVATLVLNRPPLNIITIDMIDELNAALDEADELEVQIVAFSGKGDRGFSAGVDVSDHTPDRAPSMLGKFHRLLHRLHESNFIVVAGIHGHTLGGGAELALSCDLVIAADDARIGFPEIDVGCYPPAASAFLPKFIGFHKASEMILLGQPVSAQQAEHLGLVNRVAPREKLTEIVDQYVDQLLEKSAPVLALTKRALRTGDVAANEKLYLEGLSGIQDMQEGIRAFLEKRAASWRNR